MLTTSELRVLHSTLCQENTLDGSVYLWFKPVEQTGIPDTLLDLLWVRPDGRAVAAGRASGHCPVRGTPGQIEPF